MHTNWQRYDELLAFCLCQTESPLRAFRGISVYNRVEKIIKCPLWECGLHLFTLVFIPSSPRHSALYLPIRLIFISSTHTHTRTRTHSNGVCLAQGGLSMHSKLRINAIVSVPQKLSNGGRVCLCVCVITCIPGQEVKDDALCSNYAPTSTFGDSTSARIRADTHTGSKVPRLPPETLCCSHIVCEEKERRPSASHPRRPIQLFVLDYTQITWGSRSRLL